MQYQLEVRLVWDKSMKKNLLSTVLRISHTFWKYLAGHVYLLWDKVLIPCFVKKSKVYLQDVFRICLYHALNGVIIYVTYKQNEIFGSQ